MAKDRKTSFALQPLPKDPFLIKDNAVANAGGSETKDHQTGNGPPSGVQRKSLVGLRDAVKDFKAPEDPSREISRLAIPTMTREVQSGLDKLVIGDEESVLSRGSIESRQYPMAPRATMGTLDDIIEDGGISRKARRDKTMCGQRFVRSRRLFNSARRELCSDIPPYNFPIEKACPVGKKRLTIDRILKIRNGSCISRI